MSPDTDFLLMALTELDSHDALGLAALIRSKQLSAQEVLEETIARIEVLDPRLNAVVHRHFDLAQADLDAGLPDGMFRGVPILIKNTGIAVRGMRLSTGSRLWADVVSPGDGTLASRYRAAGLVMLGKSNTPELALSFATEPEAFGPTRNPWNLDLGPGGSSGGSAAAVAAGLVPLANASDGAGSTRLPAAHCGLFGFKPSRMRNPLGPVAVEAIAGMSTPHAVTRSVRDSAALLDATAGPDRGDPYAAPASDGFLAACDRTPRRLRIGLLTASALGTPVDPELVAATRAAGALLQEMGHEVEEAVDHGYDAHALKWAWWVVAAVTAAATAQARGADLGLADPLALMEPVNAEWAIAGRSVTGIDYQRAVNTLHATARGLGRFFARHDVMLSPTTAELPQPLGEMAGRGVALADFYDRFWAHGPFTAAFNASGCPAASLPFGLSSQGLPMGVQIGAGFGQDALLFALSADVERARPWFDMRPPFHAARSVPK